MNTKELKEYKARLEDHYTAADVTPSVSIYGLGYVNAYLDQDAAKELRQEIKDRVKHGATRLPDSNGKATCKYKCMISLEDGTIKDYMAVLTSYYTDVLAIDRDGRVYKLWEGFSVTTLNHINTFLKMFDHATLSKHEWVMMETEHFKEWIY